MTTQFHIIQNDFFLQKSIYFLDKFKEIYKTVFFYIGYVGITIIVILLSPIIYTLVLMFLFYMRRSLKKELKNLRVEINSENYEAIKIKYDKLIELINISDTSIKSGKIPFILKPIVKQVAAINNIFIEICNKLSIVTIYLKENNIFMDKVAEINTMPKKVGNQMISNTNKSFAEFLKKEEPFIFE